MKCATPSLSQARGDSIQAWVQRVGHHSVQLLRGSGANGRGQHGAGLVGCILRIGQIEQRELRARPLPEPALQEWCNRGCRIGPGLHRRDVVGQHPQHGVGGIAGRADGDKQAWRFKAQRLATIVGMGHAGNLRVQLTGFRNRKRRQATIDESYGGGTAMRELDGQAQAEVRPGHAQLVFPNLVEQACAVAPE